MNVREFLANLTEQVVSHPLIHVLTETDVVDHSGFKGNFESGLRHQGRHKSDRKLKHGIVVVATGRRGAGSPKASTATERTSRVMTQMELEERIAGNKRCPRPAASP